MQDVLARAAKIKLALFDVDGVLTDGRLILDDGGVEYKAFYSRDGHGMKMLQETGVTIGIITGRTSEVVRHRMESLGIVHVYQGQRNKLTAFNELKASLKLDTRSIAFVGDDVVDLPVMRSVGLAIAVADAHDFVKQHAHWTCPSAGGRGAARDVCELIMNAQGTLQSKLHEYLAP
jgi:3-deoxy-D-manno-octulosonate 8-phosphate phosphatase (KDO 8-P phosphatase)